MGNFQWEEYWNSIKPALLQSYDQLSNDDLCYEPGQGEKVVERLQQKLGLTAEQVNALLFVHVISMEDESEEEQEILAIIEAMEQDFQTARHPLNTDTAWDF
jgi:hypothetical protein